MYYPRIINHPRFASDVLVVDGEGPEDNRHSEIHLYARWRRAIATQTGQIEAGYSVIKIELFKTHKFRPGKIIRTPESAPSGSMTFTEEEALARMREFNKDIEQPELGVRKDGLFFYVLRQGSVGWGEAVHNWLLWITPLDKAEEKILTKQDKNEPGFPLRLPGARRQKACEGELVC